MTATAIGQATTTKMKTVVRDRYGSSDVLEIDEVEKPEAGDDGVLVRVRAASLNRVDWYLMVGKPYVGRAQMGMRRPRSRTMSTEFAGTVEAVGKDVTQF